jgi:hypothetical protein
MPDETNKKLYIVHVGFYDEEPNFGVYESHTNFFVIATSPQEAKKAVKAKPIYAAKRMHTDGVQEIEAVDGQRLAFHEDAALKGGNLIQSYSYNQLNPTTPIGGVSH